jgi:pimeloyl-ACP methyl ester carboxylesterase
MSRQTGFVKGYVDAPWGQIHYLEAGAGEVVLLYPNRPRSSVIYRRLAAILAAQYRVVIMDPPGFGGSDPLPAPLEVDDLSTAVVTLLDGLGVDRFRMSGHHTGASLCVDLAVRIPDRVVAIAPSGLLMLTQEERRGRLDGTLFSPAAGNPPRPDGSHLLPFLKKYPPVPPEDLDFLTAWIVDTLASEPYQRPSADAIYRYDERATLAQIKVPTLFVQSTGPGEPPTLQRMAEARALTPGSRLVYIEGGDVHFIHHRAEELGHLLLDFFPRT